MALSSFRLDAYAYLFSVVINIKGQVHHIYYDFQQYNVCAHDILLGSPFDFSNLI